MFSEEQRRVAIDLHQVRPQLCGHDGRARLPVQGNPQVVVEGLREGGQRSRGQGDQEVEVLRRAGETRRRVLPPARKEPLRDDASARLPEGQADPLRLDRRAGPGKRKYCEFNPKAEPMPLPRKPGWWPSWRRGRGRQTAVLLASVFRYRPAYVWAQEEHRKQGSCYRLVGVICGPIVCDGGQLRGPYACQLQWIFACLICLVLWRAMVRLVQRALPTWSCSFPCAFLLPANRYGVQCWADAAYLIRAHGWYRSAADCNDMRLVRVREYRDIV